VSIELVHPDEEAFVLSDAGWRGVLALAAGRGWQPAEVLAGLTPPFPIKAAHCERLGEIIDAAMDDLEQPKAARDWRADDEVLSALFGRRSAPHWRRFARFCRAGDVVVQAGASD
jgi:hypothetical protein